MADVIRFGMVVRFREPFAVPEGAWVERARVIQPPIGEAIAVLECAVWDDQATEQIRALVPEPS